MHHPKLKEFGLRLREIRKSQGISQEALAHKVGLDRSYLGCIERGEKNITLSNLYRLQEGLNVEMAELFKNN